MPSVPATRDALVARCRSEPAPARTCALLAAVDGVEVAAHDLHGHGLDTPAPTIASVTKSLLSTVVGWAWADGLLTPATPRSTTCSAAGYRRPGARPPDSDDVGGVTRVGLTHRLTDVAVLLCDSSAGSG
jgi:CubicO group peptidase (beta-lactamase class C family)